MILAALRVLIVYDCLYPYTVGGAERWYLRLAERLAADGNEVTFATRLQWDSDDPPEIAGVEIVAVAPRSGLYTASGRRRIDEALVFGAGVLWHLLRHGRSYDVVHMGSFPYFSLLAAAIARPIGRFRLVVDWHEVWTLEYWREYLGAPGLVGWLVQRLCLRVAQQPFCFAQLTARRLVAEGMPIEPTVLEGQWEGALAAEPARTPGNRVVFVGRLIREKRAHVLPAAVTLAARQAPDLRLDVYGDGPERARVLHAIDAAGVGQLHGFVSLEEVEEAFASALCLVLPSRREGYGKVVIEATRWGTPAIVVSEPDNAAVELVDDGRNGVVATSASPEDLAAAILRVQAGGQALRDSTAAWFAEHADRLSLESSLKTVLRNYDA